MNARVEGIVDLEITCKCGHKELVSCVNFIEANNINWQCPKCEARYRIKHLVELEPAQRMRGMVIKAKR